MGNGMNKVFSGLYLGNFRDSKDKQQLEANGITHIVSILDNAKPQLDDKKYLCINAADCATQDLQQHFSMCNDFIHEARISGGHVFVHCLAGISRSSTIVTAYVMTVTSFGFVDALNSVRGARQIVKPNYGFQRQLWNFEKTMLRRERERLQKRFPDAFFNDEEVARVNLEEYRKLQPNEADDDLITSIGSLSFGSSLFDAAEHDELSSADNSDAASAEKEGNSSDSSECGVPSETPSVLPLSPDRLDAPPWMAADGESRKSK